jgi:lipopolysaccharide transport system permease protein
VVNTLFHAGISMLLLLTVSVLWGITPQWQWLLLPLLLLPLALLLWGTSLLLASLGVFMRDLPQVVTLVVGLLQFLSPVFYPASALPPLVQTLIGWNPLTVFIEQVRSLVFGSQQPSIIMWGQSLLVSLLLAALGYLLYRRVRTGFADVL